MDEKEILKLTNDLVFKSFFTYGNDYSLLNEFVSLVIGRVFNDIQVINPEINNADIAGKQIIMDLRVRTTDALVNVEMQSYAQKDYIDRALLYGTRHFANNNLKSGDGYIKTYPAYTINILSHKLFEYDEYKSEYELTEHTNKTCLSDKFKIFFLELSKIKKENIDSNIICNPKDDCDKLLLWLLLFKCEKKGDLDMFYTSNYTTINNAAKRLVSISEDEKTRTLAELREKAQSDYNSAMANQREEGREEERLLSVLDYVKLLATFCTSKEMFLDKLKESRYTEEDCMKAFSEHPEIKPAWYDWKIFL